MPEPLHFGSGVPGGRFLVAGMGASRSGGLEDARNEYTDLGIAPMPLNPVVFKTVRS